MSFSRNDRRPFAAALWFLIYFAAISITPEKDLRYSLPLLPSVVILSGLGLDVFLSRVFKNSAAMEKARCAALTLLVLFFLFNSPRMSRFLAVDASQFSGFREAGAIVHRQMERDQQTLVITTSLRAVQYYADIGLGESAKHLVGTPKTKEEFLHLLNKTSGTMIVVVDYWERTQPPWIFPVTDDVIKFFRDLGFNNARTILKEVVQKDGSKRAMPVQWIFISSGKGQ